MDWEVEGPSFDSAILVGGRIPWNGLAGSLITHVLLVPLLAWGFAHPVRRSPPRSAVFVTPLTPYTLVTLKLPPDLLKRPEPPRPVEVREPAPRPAAPSPAAAAPAPAEPAPPPVARVEVAIAPPKARPRAFPVPSESKPTSTEIVILQPPTERTQTGKVPETALPSITMVAPATPKHRTVFDVGSLQRNRSIPKNPEPGILPDAPQMATAQEAIRPKSVDIAEPKLAVYAAPPPMEMIRARNRDAVSAGGPVVNAPATLAMSSSKPVPAKETVEVPSAIVLPQAGTGSATVGGGIPAAGTPLGRAGGTPGGVLGGKGKGPKEAEDAGKEGTGAGRKAVDNPGNGGGVNTSNELAEGPPVRIIHPSTGRHDVLIVHSGVDQILPEARGLLEGDPVYTVYLNVGWTREWVMHYCIPRTGPPPPRQIGGVVTLESPQDVRAPYPLTTLVPSQRLVPAKAEVRPGEVGPRRRPALLFHGYLDAKGELTDMRQKGTDETGLGAKILKSLESWDMRPATNGDQPARVQVILVVPLS